MNLEDLVECHLRGESTAVPGELEGEFAIATKAHAALLHALGETFVPREDERFGRYRLQEELGRGGAGIVYLALDGQLNRTVALKLLLHGDHASARQIERFQREARACAGLAHPHIVRIYDFGVHEGRPYYTMELLRDGSLGLAVRAGGERVPPREAVRLVREAALGLAHAHAQGIVHRDVKPENILLEFESGPDGAGRPGSLGRARAKLSDFGLARLTEEEGAASLRTRSGEILGTPMYMAPEQAAGQPENTGPRSDVYALGAVLYHLITGATPYELGAPMAVLMRKLNQDPPAPRRVDPTVAREIESILVKAMARDPKDRYEHAGAMAEDLRRWLDGEAVLARPETFFGRWRRWARWHRGSAAAGAAVLLGLAFAGVFAQQSARMAREKQALREQRMTELRERAALCLDMALTLRRIGQPVRIAAPYLDQVREAAARAEQADPAHPAPNDYRGRMYQALQRNEEALAEHDRALEKDPSYARSRFERAILYAGRLADRIDEVRQAWNREQGRRLAESGRLDRGGSMPESTGEGWVAAVSRDARAQELRQRFLADVDGLERGAVGESNGGAVVSKAWMACLRGLQRLLGGDGDRDLAEARRFLEEARSADPGMMVAVGALAHLLVRSGNLHGARTVCAEGLGQDAGYVRLHLLRGRIAQEIGHEAQRGGEDPVPWHRAAEADFSRALELDPERIEAWLGRGAARLEVGLVLLDRREAPEEEFRGAALDHDRALALDPHAAGAWVGKAAILDGWAYLDTRRGGDAVPRLREAERFYSRALELDPHLVIAWAGRAGLKATWGNHLRVRGRDPVESYRASEEDFSRALEFDPEDLDLWNQRAEVRRAWASTLQERGADARELLARAEADYTHVLARAPDYQEAWSGRGDVRWMLAQRAQGEGRETAGLRQAAREDLDRALARDAEDEDALLTRGRLNAAEGRWAEAVADFERVRELAPDWEGEFVHELEEARKRREESR